MSKRISPQFFMCLMTAVVSNLSVTGSKGEDDNMACVNEPLWHTAFIGDSVRINCTYLLTGESSVKHFYRDNPDSDVTDLISTHTSPMTKKDRFSLTDHKEQGVYTVMISMAGEEDTGRYRCAKRTVNENFTTCLTQIHLNIVNERHIKTKKSGPQQTTAAPSSTTTLHDLSFSGRIIGATVACLALLVTVGIVLIVFIHKLCRTQGGSIMQSTNAGQNLEDNHNDRVYEEIKERNQGQSSGDTTLSVYALADLPAEQLHYASVSFQQEAVTVYTDRNPHPDTDGTHPPALYSTVKDLEEL